MKKLLILLMLTPMLAGAQDYFSYNELRGTVSGIPYMVFCGGGATPFDGGQGWFHWSDTTCAADDGVNIIKNNGWPNPCWAWVRCPQQNSFTAFSTAMITPFSWELLFQHVSGDTARDTITMPSVKRVETFKGTTNSSGLYTVTFANTYSTAPSVQANVIGGTTEQMCRIVSISTTQCVVHVFQRATVLSLALSTATTNVNGASVDVLVTEN